MSISDYEIFLQAYFIIFRNDNVDAAITLVNNLLRN